MAWLFVLLLQLPAQGLERIEPSFIPADRQIEIYHTNIQQEKAVDESVWALLTLARENETRKKQVVETGDRLGQEWVHHLANEESVNDAIHQIALEFESEHLHLFLQLLRGEQMEKIRYYEEFYSGQPVTRLQELNRRLAYSREIDPAFLLRDEWDFSMFLITAYNLGFQFTESSEHVYREIAQQITEFHQTEYPDPFHWELIQASLLNALYNSQQYGQMAQRYNSFLELRHLPNITPKRNLYWRLEFAVYRAGQVDRSLHLQREYIIPLTEELNDRENLMAVTADHGANLYLIGKYHEAKSLIETVLEENEIADSNVRARLYNNLGLAYYKLGEIDNYLEAQFGALSHAQVQDNHNLQLGIYRNLHVYYRNNRNWDLSLNYIDEARQLAERTGNKNELASIILSMASHFRNLNQPDTAASYLEEAEQLLTEATATDYRLDVRLLHERASLYRETERLAESTGIYKRIAEISAENNNNPVYLDALANLAEIYYETGEISHAEAQIREFNIHDVTVVDFDILIKAREVEALLALERGRERQADRILATASQQVLERAATSADHEGGYWHVEDSYLDLFQTYADMLISQNRYAETISLLDRIKTINDASLFDNKLITSERMSEEALAEEKILAGRIDRLRKQLLVAPESEHLPIRNEIAALMAQKNQLMPQRDGNRLSGDLRVWPIQARLRGNQAILHMTRIAGQLYLVQITADELNVQKIPMNEEHEALFEEAITGITNGDTDLLRLHDVYSYLNLENLPPSVTSLIVVPDSYLYQLPLDVLPTGIPQHAASYGSARYLIESMEVRYLNNLQEYMTQTPGTLYELDYAGFGISQFQESALGEQLVTLPMAPYEVEAIRGELTRFQNLSSFTEARATPENFIKSAANARILHLATHSKISEEDPLFSRLYLAPGEEPADDANGISGQIFAYELFDLNLRSDLIMLNSCESGSGRYFQGSGIMGISRALRYAGARSLILNSWSVNDQYASDFAIEFYKQINLGGSKSGSLREAKLHFLKNKNANPHYWGPYMLNGENNPMTRKPGTFPVYAALFFLFTAGVWATRKQQKSLKTA
ncbi:MAG: CHAT domain-containing protein [Balneolaceae bacterium]